MWWVVVIGSYHYCITWIDAMRCKAISLRCDIWRQGGWPFSTAAHGWPISDCTSEGLKASKLAAWLLFICEYCCLDIAAVLGDDDCWCVGYGNMRGERGGSCCYCCLQRHDNQRTAQTTSVFQPSLYPRSLEACVGKIVEMLSPCL